MGIRIRSLNPVVKKCSMCKRNYAISNGKGFFPLLHTPGICTDCNADILKHLLKCKHSIMVMNYDK